MNGPNHSSDSARFSLKKPRSIYYVSLHLRGWHWPFHNALCVSSMWVLTHQMWWSCRGRSHLLYPLCSNATWGWAVSRIFLDLKVRFYASENTDGLQRDLHKHRCVNSPAFAGRFFTPSEAPGSLNYLTLKFIPRADRHRVGDVRAVQGAAMWIWWHSIEWL